MVSRGARHFIFLSRSGADKPEAAALVEELHEIRRSQYPDMSIQVIRGDVSIRDDVSRAISCATNPIKGVVQAAMVLKVRIPIRVFFEENQWLTNFETGQAFRGNVPG